MKAVIFTGGEQVTDEKKIACALRGADYILFADSGIEILRRYPDLEIDYLVGDFDSADPALLEQAKKRARQCIPLVPEKDETDTHAAVLIACRVGVDEIVILGGTGKRLDHSLGNLNVLYALEQDGIRAQMIGQQERVLCVRKRTLSLEGTAGKTFSIFPMESKATVSIQGAKYPLLQHTIYTGETIGVSNIAESDTVILTVHDGTVAVLINDTI